jgi:uncharacterized membrane protein
MRERLDRARQYRNVAYTLRRIARDSVDAKVVAAAGEVARDYERMARALERKMKTDVADFTDLHNRHH